MPPIVAVEAAFVLVIFVWTRAPSWPMAWKTTGGHSATRMCSTDPVKSEDVADTSVRVLGPHDFMNASPAMLAPAAEALLTP